MSRILSIYRSACRASSIGLFALLLTLQAAGLAHAQDPANAPERPVVKPPTKSYVLEGIIFAVLCGATLYAVCRSSPRGN